MTHAHARTSSRGTRTAASTHRLGTMSQQTSTVDLCGEDSAAASRRNHTVPTGHHEPADKHGRSLRRRFCRCLSSKRVACGGRSCWTFHQKFEGARTQRLRDQRGHSSSNDNEGSVAAGGGSSSTKSSPFSSCAAPLLLLWERGPTEPSL